MCVCVCAFLRSRLFESSRFRVLSQRESKEKADSELMSASVSRLNNSITLSNHTPCIDLGNFTKATMRRHCRRVVYLGCDFSCVIPHSVSRSMSLPFETFKEMSTKATRKLRRFTHKKQTYKTHNNVYDCLVIG